MVSRNRAARAAFGAKDHRHRRLAAEHVAVLGALVGDLIHRQRRKVHVHDLGNRAQPGHGRAHGRPADGRFGDRRIQHAPFAKLLPQPARRAISAAIQPHVFAHDEHALVAQHFLAHGFHQRLGIGDLSACLGSLRTRSRNARSASMSAFVNFEGAKTSVSNSFGFGSGEASLKAIALSSFSCTA